MCLQAIERKPRKFNPLVIPKALQADLPFESKPKNIPHRKRPVLEDRRAVVMEPHERKVHALVQHLQLIRNDKVCDSRYWPDIIFYIFISSISNKPFVHVNVELGVSLTGTS